MLASGSCLTNKYAEGYPNKRYYEGQQVTDLIEKLAQERAKKLFGAEHANVQPHSGSQANAAVYMALLEPGDTVLGMSLAHGGHLTHGSKVNFSGKIYNAVQYGLNEASGEIDYEQVEALAKLPTLDELRAQLLGLIQAPARNIAATVASGVRQIVNVLDAYAQQEDEAEAEADAEAEA